MKVNCSYCNSETEKTTAEINRAKKRGGKLYCNLQCAGKAKKLNKPIEQKRKEKSEYDKLYREKNSSLIKKKKSEYFKKDYSENPEKYRLIRKKKYKKHLEYLRTDKYKEYKRQYDKIHNAKMNYGEYWESSILLFDLESIVPRFEAKQDKGLINKSQKRKRNYEKIKCEEFERNTLGNIERC